MATSKSVRELELELQLAQLRFEQATLKEGKPKAVKKDKGKKQRVGGTESAFICIKCKNKIQNKDILSHPKNCGQDKKTKKKNTHKTKSCAGGNNCRNRDECSYIHPGEDGYVAYVARMCKKVGTDEGCPFGDDCRFTHPVTGSAATEEKTEEKTECTLCTDWDCTCD
jgi:hypothetical protein